MTSMKIIDENNLEKQIKYDNKDNSNDDIINNNSTKNLL
jgi:hypothetical protein